MHHQINFLHLPYSKLQVSQSLLNYTGGFTIRLLLARLSVNPVACGTTDRSATGDPLSGVGISLSHGKSLRSNNACGGASLVFLK